MTFSYVRRDAASGQWRFLTPDEVTVEKIVGAIAGDIAGQGRSGRGREALRASASRQLGSVIVGKSGDPIRLRRAAQRHAAQERSAPDPAQGRSSTLLPPRRVARGVRRIPRGQRRLLDRPGPGATSRTDSAGSSRSERLKCDPKFNEIRTGKDGRRGRASSSRKSGQIARQAARGSPSRAGPRDALLGRRLEGRSTAAASADAKRPGARRPSRTPSRTGSTSCTRGSMKATRSSMSSNIDRLLDTPPAKRAALDPDLGLFDADGHVHADNVLVVAHSSSTATEPPRRAGAELRQHFAGTDVRLAGAPARDTLPRPCSWTGASPWSTRPASATTTRRAPRRGHPRLEGLRIAHASSSRRTR